MSTLNLHELRIDSPEQQLCLYVDSQTSIRVILDATELRVRAACGGLGGCGACLIQIISGDFNPPTLVEYQKIPPEELQQGMRLACQLFARSFGRLHLQYPAPHSDWKSLDDAQLYHPETGLNELHSAVYGVAVDLGTTHIRLSLWNRQTGQRIATRYSINPQVARGADVLTRLDAEQADSHAAQSLKDQVRQAIIEGIRDILKRDIGEVSTILAKIGKLVIVGNTAMLSLLCGSNSDALYQPDNWQLPISCLPDDIEQWRKVWRMPQAELCIVQPLGGFIGSDLLAALLATEVIQQNRPILLLDFGTNTEIALWDTQNLWVSSVPGGPAFEGMGMRNGLSAEAGAICRVEKPAEHWLLHTLNNVPARGFCASGFVDAIAILLAEKQLKSAGRFNVTQSHILLDPANVHTAIYLHDIDLFQRAKASTAAAMLQLISRAGLYTEDLDTLWICGSFGQHLNIESAQSVGLLPPLAKQQIRVFPQASLAGCEQLLLTAEGAASLQRISSLARIVNFAGVLDYEDCFIDNLRLQPLVSSSKQYTC